MSHKSKIFDKKNFFTRSDYTLILEEVLFYVIILLEIKAILWESEYTVMGEGYEDKM